jgi:dihydropteroate synthase
MTAAPAFAEAGLRSAPCVLAVDSPGPTLCAAALARRLAGTPLEAAEARAVFLVSVAPRPASLPRWCEPFVRSLARGSSCDRLLLAPVALVRRLAAEDRLAALLAAALDATTAEHRWRIRGATLELSPAAPRVVGVLNVTPDSFSDGGRWVDVAEAVAHGEELARAGAAVVDVGGESTRPGAARVAAQLQIERVVPVIERLRARIDVPIAIDTTSAEVARAALAAGAAIVNDTSALADDDELAAAVAQAQAGLVLMHRLGSPATMQAAPRYECCVAEVAESLGGAAAAAQRRGVGADAIVLDPGIGFGKRLEDNLDLIGGVGALRSLGFPVMLGASRKSFLGTLTGRGASERDAATLATTAAAFDGGCDLVRVHDVASSVDVLKVLAALRAAAGGAAVRAERSAAP